MGLPLLILSLLAVVGCGDNTAVCGGNWKDNDPAGICYAAQTFAARDSASVVLDVDEIERYAEPWRRAVDREPILRGRVPQTYRNTPAAIIQINTTNALVIDAWAKQQVRTGIASFDAVISELGAVTIEPRYAPDPAPGSPWYFEVHETSVYSEEQLNDVLAADAAWLNDPMSAARDDGEWTWVRASGSAGSVAQVDFRFGWGDCFVACAGFHSVRAVIQPDGDATVYDLGGDPLPPNLQLDPRTRPIQ
jgi:hypothetical protein